MLAFLTTYRLRQGLVVGLLGLLFGGSFQLALPAASSRQPSWLAKVEGEDEDEENDADRVRTDRPDLALLQDMDLTRDPATGTVPSERLLAAARYNETRLKGLAQRGVATTTTTGLANASWAERGPSNVSGRILGLLVDPTDASGNTLWAGSAGGGLWKATSATTTAISWHSVNASLSNLAVTTIAAVPGTSPLVMYCGTGEGYFNSDAIQGNGIWKSTDGGNSWAQLAFTNTANFAFVQKIVVHPVSKDVYAATRTGLWRSQDGGVTWSQVLSQTTAQASVSNRVADVEIGADNTIFAAFGIFSTDGIYRSATGNVNSWTKLNTLSGSGLPTTGYQRIELACAPSDANRLYALFQSSASGTPLLDIYRSMDKGNTWAAMARPGATAGNPTYDFTNSQAWYGLAAAVSPADPNALYVGGIDLWFTSDGGNATPTNVVWDHESVWNYPPSSPYYVHADHHAIAFVPTATAPANKAFFGSDGGVAYSADASISTATEPQFSDRNNGLNVTQFYAVAMHPSNANYFLAGAQDNGSRQFTAAGINSTPQVTGGDGGFCAIDQTNAAYQFTSYVFNQYFRSTDGGSTFTSFIISNSAGSFINPFDYDGRNGVLYAAYTADSYLAWTNAGSTATATTTINPSLGTGSGKATHITVSPLTANRIYVGTNAGKILRVDNANTASPTVTTIRTGSAGTSVSCVAVDPANENHLLATYSNYGITNVYETTDGGTTWTAQDGTLPDMPVRWALFDPRGTTRALLATEMGVYSTDNLNGSSTVWNPVTNGPLNVRVDMLRYRTSDKLVAAATHGRGLFTSAIFALPLPVTLINLAATRQPAGAVVRWQTASEQHASRFEVERSVNAVDYQKIGSVAAVGTSTNVLTYTLPDATVGFGAYYYRLRQVDTDGAITYSAPVALAAAVTTGSVMLGSVYPNPFRADLSVELLEPVTGSATLDLVDAQGRRVWAGTVTAIGRQLQLKIPATVAPGTYVLTVRANGQQAHRRVVKE